MEKLLRDDVSRQEKCKQSTIKLRLGIAMVVILAVWILYVKIFAYPESIGHYIEQTLGEPISLIQVSQGDTIVLFASGVSCQKVLGIFDRLKGKAKLLNYANTVNETEYYEKQEFAVSFLGANKSCSLYETNGIKSKKSLRIISGEEERNYLLNQNINKIIQDIIEQKRSDSCLTQLELIQMFDDKTDKIKETITLADLAKYGQINVETNGEELCMKIYMENSCRLHVIFMTKGLTADSKPVKFIVFWSDLEYKSSDQTDFLQTIKERTKE